MEGLVSLVKELLEKRDYTSLADLLWIPSNKSQPSRFSSQILQLLNSPLNITIPTSNIKPLWIGEILSEHQKILVSLSSITVKTYDEFSTFQYCQNAVQIILKNLTPETFLEIPLLKRLCWNLFSLAQSQQSREEAARLLPKIFTLTVTDRAPLASSKKWAAVFVATLLFRLYFRLGTVRLCNNIIRALETAINSGDFPPLKQLPKSQLLLYFYYRARLAMNQSLFREAENFLQQAVSICPDQFSNQKRELMIYFILVKMIHGHLPSDDLLVRHNLTREFSHLKEAIRTGNLRTFDENLLVNQEFYMKKEIFLLIQLHLRNLILRSFFKKMYIHITYMYK